MGINLTLGSSNDNHEANPNLRPDGFYWVRLNDEWSLGDYHSKQNLFYLPGYFEGIDSSQIHEINERGLYKKFEGYQKKKPGIRHEIQPTRSEGFYWVMHDAMWFAAYYLPSSDEFFFPGQEIGFDPSELEEIDELRIERNTSLASNDSIIL